MSKKLFYTDPLASAYMAREFGVKFKAVDSDGDVWHLRPSTFANKDGLEQYTEHGESMTLFGSTELSSSFEIYYIHLDSYHIFEPQVGDYVSFRKDKEVYLVDEYSSWDVPPDKIILRNNKPFFNPDKG